ncbi:MAG TPA: crosslink repair DNA glycosylase YcaQ family protein [Rhodanobacteraceae bacterium]|nr:crosslink repair DNA glycosylase YcaQ family protein [Rhodanobacteraceae bacterium]
MDSGTATLRLSASQARLLHLAAQGLLSRPRRRARRPDLLSAIARMQLLQIDTIHVVARSPYLVLYSRLGAYPPKWLDELLAVGALFECWAHEACFAPMADLALHRHHMLEMSTHWAIARARRTLGEHGVEMDALLAHVREAGPVKSADFARPRSGAGGWWAWKEEKRLLEAWFALGELMIARRENFQRVYDLRERVLAPGDGLAAPMSDQRVRRQFILGAVKALGVTQARWIADYFRMRPAVKDRDLDVLVEAGDLLRIIVNGWEAAAYVHRECATLAQRAAAGRLRATHTTLLSPFDPVVWDRERAAAMFGFDYRLECYTPAPKRRFGYYVLPILHRGRLAGRLDAKAHRAEGVFEVKALFLEAGEKPTPALLGELARALRSCAAWHGTPAVTIGRSDPAAVARALRPLLTG